MKLSYMAVTVMNTFLIAFMFSLNTQGADLTLEYSNSSLGDNLYGVGVGVVDHSGSYAYLDSDYRQKIVCGNSDGTIRVLGYHNGSYTTDRIWTNSNSSTYGLALGDIDYRDFLKSIDVVTGNSSGEVDISYYSPSEDYIFLEGQSAIPAFENPMTIGANGSDIRGLAIGNPLNRLMQQTIAGDEAGFVHVIAMDYDSSDPYGRMKDPTLITFSEQWNPVDVGSKAYGIAVGDVDSDGVHEIVVGHAEGLSILEYDSSSDSFVTIWNSDAVGEMLSDGNFWGVAVGDVDNDGENEIVCGTYAGKVYVLNNNGTGYDIELIADVGYKAYGIAIGDVDGGTINEIVATGSDSSGNNAAVYVYEWDGSDYVQEHVSVSDLGAHAGIYGALAIGDPDYDGQNEIIIGSSSKLSVMQVTDYGVLGVDTALNPDAGLKVEWRSTGILPTDDAIRGIGIADLNGNGDANISLGSTLGWLRTLEFDAVTKGYQIEWERRRSWHVYGMTVGPIRSVQGEYPMQFCTTSSNQRMDTFGFNTNATDLTGLYDETYSIELRDPRDSSLTDWSYGIAVGDVDYNYSSGTTAPWGREIVVGGAGGEVYVFKYSTSSNQFGRVAQIPLMVGPIGARANDVSIHGMAIGDVDGDGQNEIVAGGNGQLYILEYNITNQEYEVVWESDGAGLMVGEGNFFGIAIGNIDDDSNNEIVCSSYGGKVYVLNHTGGGAYASTLVKDVGYRGYAIAIENLDGQAGNEFVVIGNNSTSTQGTAYLFKYDSAQSAYIKLASSTEYLGCSAGSFGSIGIGDVDNDGTNEVVIGSANMLTVLQYYP